MWLIATSSDQPLFSAKKGNERDQTRTRSAAVIPPVSSSPSNGSGRWANVS